ncbi:hypothetical protein BLNAU_6830 [Blattamonas nauphoetae]|uniref:Uncharacterized protein n=1 Tax=Blattamonas nauphoetae TaxID=2049346 RepID=A0ABQ9Y308_9EUKA|nr:hypothetical protein BLNAU_6830 [Blattamonas nauphoetae]
MTEIDKEPDTFSNTERSDLSSFELPVSMDSSPFLNWDDAEEPRSELEHAVVFRSLVATLKMHHALDESFETKAVAFLEYVDPQDSESADDFLHSLGRTSGNSSPDFVQSIGVIISSTSQAIIGTTMKMLITLFGSLSVTSLLALIQADLITQIIDTLNPLSFSFVEAEDIHVYLLKILDYSLILATPYYLTRLGIEDDRKQQAVHETILKRVFVPSEKYMWHLCVNNFSIVDGDLSFQFRNLLTRILEIWKGCNKQFKYKAYT